MYPNASLSTSAMNAMKTTNKFTHHLLFYPDAVLQVGVSPMVRAKQTACLVKPLMV
jgi:phosphohistidine phosphatase SixA